MFRRASVEQRRQEARAQNPELFDRLTAIANTNINHDKCWQLYRNIGKDGYGILRVNGRKERAHRMMFELYFPRVPAPVVRHICNNPSCINPAHLRGGTPHDNAMDRMFSNRGGDLRGENNGRAKLTDQQVREIRASTLSGAELGRIYGISTVMACRIKTGKAWKHV